MSLEAIWAFEGPCGQAFLWPLGALEKLLSAEVCLDPELRDHDATCAPTQGCAQEEVAVTATCDFW